LDIVAGAGNTTFTGAVGGSEPLGNTTIGTAVLTAAAIEAQGTLAITNSGTSEIDGVISDGASALALTKAGAGSLTLSGTNTYTGTSTISAGSIIIGADAGLGAAPGSAAAGHFVFASGGSGTLNTTASFTLHTNRGIALTGNGIINTNASRTLTYAGVIAGSGTITKSGAGTLTLSGTNTHTGSNIISAGTLSVAGDRAFGAVPGSTDADNIVFSSGGSGILNASGNFTLNTKRGITLTGNGTIDVNNSRTLTYGGIATGSSRLTKTSAGTLSLGGVNTYTGGTTITLGTIILDGANRLYSTGEIVFANAAAILNLDGNHNTIGRITGGGNSAQIQLGGGNLTINLPPAINGSFAGKITGTGSFIKTGTGHQYLSN
jgi:autotransporter-associated beta strand protein